MDNSSKITILKEARAVYNKDYMSGLENWAQNYLGKTEDKVYLDKVVARIIRMNSTGSRIFEFSSGLVETLLKEVS